MPEWDGDAGFQRAPCSRPFPSWTSKVLPACPCLAARSASTAVVRLSAGMNSCPREGGAGLTRLLGVRAGSQVGLAGISVGLGDAEKGNSSFCFSSVS